MKIVKFYGGLGNQLFQYAMLVALREHHHEEVLMDTSIYQTYGLHNGFEIKRIFNVSAREATPEQIKSLSLYTTHYKIFRLYHYLFPTRKTEFRERRYGTYYPEAIHRGSDCLYDGYWQHHEYFASYRNFILNEFTTREPLDAMNRRHFEEYKASDSTVSIHIRRGDFLKSRLYRGLCDTDYYVRAIHKAKEIVGKKAFFVFFSNDMAWCKEHLAREIEDGHFIFADWNTGTNSYKDLLLMSACKINIIANSSFSWWGAYLNQRDDKVVIAPRKWINSHVQAPIQMPEWLQI